MTTTAWCIEFPETGVRSEDMWPDRDAACRWASRELGPGKWHAIEAPAFTLPRESHPALPVHSWPYHRLTERELITLDILSGLKPFARAEEMERWGCGDYKSLANVGRLQRMGFYTVSKSGAITPNRARIKLALNQHELPTTVRDKYGYSYRAQGMSDFKPTIRSES